MGTYPDLHPDITQSMRDFGTLSSKQEVSIKYFLSEFKEPCGGEDRNSARAKGDGKHEENKALYINRIHAHMNSWRRRQHAKGHKGLPVPDGVLHLKEEMDACPICGSDASSNRWLLANEALVFYKRISLWKSTTLDGRRGTQQQMTSRNKT